MSPWARRRLGPDGRGGFALRLPAPERALLTSLPGQLDALLAGVDPDDDRPTDRLPSPLARLLPIAYPRDVEADAAFARTTRADLVAGHREALATLSAVVGRGRATGEELELVCGALNDLRLVLGTALEVTEDPEPVDEADPAYPQWVCYGYLSALQAEIIDALAGQLPPPLPGADDEAPEDPWGDPLGDLRWDGTPRPEP